MHPDGTYELLKPRKGGKRRCAQEELLFTLGTPS
jgi:hypothetical protein